ncbi:MAG: hypothetical protein KBG48_24575 [Kofleriaceae bacterium]|nr:hypothetical protein [Kofleriaceae bacterium]
MRPRSIALALSLSTVACGSDDAAPVDAPVDAATLPGVTQASTRAVVAAALDQDDLATTTLTATFP